jgi:hypothetical protein
LRPRAAEIADASEARHAGSRAGFTKATVVALVGSSYHN